MYIKFPNHLTPLKVLCLRKKHETYVVPIQLSAARIQSLLHTRCDANGKLLIDDSYSSRSKIGLNKKNPAPLDSLYKYFEAFEAVDLQAFISAKKPSKLNFNHFD